MATVSQLQQELYELSALVSNITELVHEQQHTLKHFGSLIKHLQEKIEQLEALNTVNRHFTLDTNQSLIDLTTSLDSTYLPPDSNDSSSDSDCIAHF